MSIFITNKYTTWYFNIIYKAQSENRQKYQGIYYEKHHIIPKALKGGEEITNLVLLTAREHFICHLLLPNMLSGIDKRNMSFGIWSMIHGNNSKHSRYTPNSHLYEVAKKIIAKAISELHTGKIVSKETRKKMSKNAKGRLSPFKGKTHTTESKLKNSESSKGQIPWNKGKEHKWGSHTKETKRKISESNKGKIISEETRIKISITKTGQTMDDNFKEKCRVRRTGTTWSDEVKAKISKAHKGIPKEKFTCYSCGKMVGGKNNLNRWHNDNCKSG